jgi:hypothetical protein
LKIVTDAYVLPIPQGWAAQNTGRTIAVYRPDGVGAINISRMRRPGKPATEDELREYLADDLKAEGAKVERARVGAFAGIVADYVARGSCWRSWLLAEGDCVVFVTYNCKAEHVGAEAEAVEQLVSALSPAAAAG